MKKSPLMLVAMFLLAGLMMISCGKKEETATAPTPAAPSDAGRAPSQTSAGAPSTTAALPVGSPAQSLTSLDALIPPDTIVLFAVRDAAKALNDFKTTALYHAFMDPSMDEFRKKLFEGMNAAGQASAFSLESGPWQDEFQKDALMGVIQKDINPATKTGLFLITDQTGHEQAHKIFFKDMILVPLQKKNPAMTITSEPIGGVTVGIFGAPNSPMLYSIENRGIFTYATTREAIEALIKQTQTPDTALRSSPAWQKALASIGAGDSTVVFVDLASVIQKGASGLTVGPMRPILEATGVMPLQSFVISTRVEDRGFRSATTVSMSQPRQGLFDIFGQPAAPEFYGIIPEETVIAGEFKLKTGAELWQQFLAAVQKSVPLDQYQNFQSNLEQMQLQMRINLKDDLFSPLDGRLGYAIWGAIPMMPNVLIMAGSKDSAKLMNTMGTLIGSGMGQTPQQAAYRDVAYYTISMPPMPNQICWAALGDVVILANQPAALQRCIDISKDKKGALTSSAKYQVHAAKMPKSGVMFSYSEIETILNSITQMQKSMAPLGAQFGMLMPDFGAASKHLFGNSAVMTVSADSLAVDSYASASGMFPLLMGMFGSVRVANFSEASVRSHVSRVRSDHRSLATALESYYVDNNDYPAHAAGDMGINAYLPDVSPARSLTTFRRASMPNGPHSLTTPIAYITNFFRDPYGTGAGDNPYYGYYRDKNGWILLSAGPDGDYDIDPAKDYNSAIPQPSIHLLSKSYDPTNGTVSDGDIFRVKQ